MRLNQAKILTIILILIIALGAFLRFYKLDWGNGLFAHPDEYHIVSSVSQLSFPSQMHPHFFAYGTVTIYLIYFLKQLLEFILHTLNTNYLILNTFLVGRFISAIFSTLTIYLIFQITATFLNKKWACLSAFLVALTPGLIQQAHFLTPESALIFFILLSLYSLILFTKNLNSCFAGRQAKFLILAAISFGLALGVKISSVVFFPTLILAIISTGKSLSKILQLISLITFISLITLILTSPFIFLDPQKFISTFKYEGGVASGNLLVFYTRQFINTIPILFQLEKILPYALGPALLICGISGFFLMVYSLIKHRENFTIYSLIITAFLSLFLSNSFLFAKWTRFISPTFPFFAIFATFCLYQISQLKIPRIFPLILNSLFLLLTSLWTATFFSIYLKPDVRITTSEWLEQNTLPGATFLVEGGNTIDLPLRGDFHRLSLDFYNLESDAKIRQDIIKALAQSDYFLVQSRRVFLNHQRLPDLYPQTAQFYDDLFAGNLGFTLIKEFSSFPSLKISRACDLTIFGNLKLEIPDEVGEETWSVFDHPVIRIYKKI